MIMVVVDNKHQMADILLLDQLNLMDQEVVMDGW